MCPAREGRNSHHAIVDTSPCVAVHPSDLAACLVALEASVELRSRRGERSEKVAQFLVSPSEEHRSETIIKADEVITAITVPAVHAHAKSCYLKAMDRKAWAFALVGVAAVVELQEGKLQNVRLCLSGVANTPMRLTDVEARLEGCEPLDSVIEEAAILSTQGLTPLSENGYKLDLVQGLVRSSLHRLLQPDS